MTALILGFFASSWFGWAQESPPAIWRPFLVGGSVLSLGVAAVGGVLAWRGWSGDSALKAPQAMRHYVLIVGVEFGVAGVGAAAIAGAGYAGYLAPWICLVVGVHFWPMAAVLRNRSLIVLGTVLSAVGVAAMLISGPVAIASSAVTGVGAGVALLGVASGELLRLLSRARQRPHRSR